MTYSASGRVGKHVDGADRRAGTAAPLERQANEAEYALAEQRLQIAKALDVRDVELKAGLVNQGVDIALGARAHGIDAKMHNALPRQPLGCRHIDAGVVRGIGRLWKGASVMSRAEQERTPLREGHPRPFHRRSQLGCGAVRSRRARL